MIIGAYILIILLCVFIACFIHYKLWRSHLVKRLEQRSSIIKTAMGEVEYIIIGPADGPILLISHSGGSGYDNVFLYDFLVNEGFRIICPSKPGYLRTSLKVGKTFEEHADMFASLLDCLGIHEKVAILGVSLGGPAALQFALRHQERTACLIMQDAVSHEYHASKEAENSILGKLYLSSSGRKFLSWLMSVFTYLWPKQTFATYLKVETLYDRKQIKEIVNEIMKSHKETKKFKQFADMSAPLDLRAVGMDNEMIYASKLPRYPLENIKVPVLVTQSRMDRDVAKSHGDFVGKTVINAETYYFDGCGHMFWFGDEWPKIKTKLIEFLKKYMK
ncbi:MAG: alpha/beta hydrolase [Candidatus Ancaeobacter aquaticus]|nr:alpha/beta hydrolase [Candidatus Ancaeobacter aquaticus]